MILQAIRDRIASKKGNTLVEMLVTMALLTVLLAMAAATLSGAFRIFLRIQDRQYAQSILDTAMTEVRALTEEAVGYVKLYQDDFQNPLTSGKLEGNMIEFVNKEGYVVVLSTGGCEETQIQINGNSAGRAKKVPKGRLLSRYYFRNPDGSYSYQQGSTPVARGVEPAYGEGFYMKKYLEVSYSLPKEYLSGERVTSLVATFTLYQDLAHTKVAAVDHLLLEFSRSLPYKIEATAQKET